MIRKRDFPWIMTGIAVGLIVLGVGTLIFLTYKTYEVNVKVAKMTWQRSINIEHYKTLTKEDWDVPSDGRIIDNENRIRRYKDVLVGYESKTRQVRVQTGTRRVRTGSRDLGNGYFEDTYSDVPVYENRTETYQSPVYEKQPVYDTWYTYEVDRWVVVDTKTTGGADREVYWPDIKVQGDNEREGQRSQTYIVHFKSVDDVWEHKLNYDTWSRYRTGSDHVIVVNYWGTLQEVKDEPKN